MDAAASILLAGQGHGLPRAKQEENHEQTAFSRAEAAAAGQAGRDDLANCGV